jgi:hypothetical protein
MMSATMTTDEDRVTTDPAVAPSGRFRWVTDPSSYFLTYAGVLGTLAGFALIAIGWAKVAGLTDVWRQMPYLLSAGFPGLGLVMAGLLTINIAAKRQDAAVRTRQMAQLGEALQELTRALDER